MKENSGDAMNESRLSNLLASKGPVDSGPLKESKFYT